MNETNYRQKNLLKDLIYLGQTKPVSKQTVKGLFRFAIEPLLDAQNQKSLILLRLLDTTSLDGVLKRLEYTDAEVYSFDDYTKGENLAKEDIWGDTEFLVVLSPRYSAVLLWDYTTEAGKNTSCLYYLLNSKDVNNVIRIINQNSKIDLMRYTQEYTPERRGNELLNSAVHRFIDFANSFVEETALVQATSKLIDENDNIAEKYNYISSKTREVSHDIKNHLSIIDLYSKIIEKRTMLLADGDLQESLNNAVSCIKKSKQSIENLLSEIRSIQGTKLQSHNFAQILEQIVFMVKPRFENSGVQLDVSNEFQGDVLIDENKFLNVLINLLYNALGAIRENGYVSLCTEQTSDNMLKIFVIDNGMGIEQSKQDCIFDEGYTSKINGNGLGLYISRESMREQYGDLKFVSSEKGRTVFEVTVPKV
jgi:signal transduction histidine kinase